MTLAIASARHHTARRRLSWLVALAVATAGADAARAQSPQTPVDTIVEGRRLRDAGDFETAAAMLVAFAESHPENAGAARLAGQTLYWARDFARSRSVYESAVERHPDDVELRLEYVRMLVETGDEKRAREVVGRALDAPEGAGRGYTLLGTAAYWRGDFTTARRFFVAALRADSAQPEARRQLEEIEVASASWARVGLRFRHDDQPLDQVIVEGESGWFATPLTPLTLRFRSLRATDVPQDAVLGSTVLGPETVVAAEGGVSQYFAATKLTLSAGAGFVRHGAEATSDWTGRAALGWRLPAGLTARGHWRREPYAYTVASLEGLVMTQNLGVALDWNDALRGWLGAAAVERERYPDANTVLTAYAWALAPLVRRAVADLRVGYRFVAQDATENRFVPVQPVRPLPPGQGAQQLEGRYEPYHTPSALGVHSLLASAELRASRRATLRASADYGVHARDDAPVLFSVPGTGVPGASVERVFYRRSFNPWSARGALDVALSNTLRLAVGGEHTRGAYYSATSGSVQLTYTFLDLALRRVRNP